MSAALLAVALVGMSKVATSLDRQSRLLQQRATASQILQNRMETLATQNAEQRKQLAAAPSELSERIRRKLLNARFTVSVASLAPAEQGQRITLELIWNPIPDTDPTRLALTTFFYESAGFSESTGFDSGETEGAP